MNIRPLYDRVVVKRQEEEVTSAGGIILTGSAKEKPTQGKVIAVGDGALKENGELRPLAVKVGDEVIFGPYAGSTVKIDGEEVIILSENEIYGVVTPTAVKEPKATKTTKAAKAKK